MQIAVFFLWIHLAHSGYFENRIPRVGAGVCGWGERGRGAYSASLIIKRYTKRLNKTESPIFG